MKKSFWGALALSTAVALSGCQTFGGGQSNSNVDARLTQNGQAEFFSKSGWQACAVGVGIGVGSCLLGGAKNPVVCSAIAALAACGVLMGANYYYDQQRIVYKTKEERLDAYIRDVEKDTDEVNTLSDSARKVLAQNNETLRSLKAKVKEGKISATAKQTELANIDANLKFLNTKLAKAKEALEQWRALAAKEAQDGMKSKKLNNKIANLSKKVAELEKLVNNTANQRAAIS